MPSSLETNLGEVMQQHLLPAIDALFSELSTNETLYRIERLHVDVGTVAKHNWEQELTEKVITTLRQQIVLQQPVWQSQANPTNPQKKALQGIDALLYYLHNGRLPWYTLPGVTLRPLLREWLETDPADLLLWFIEQTRETEWLRLIYLAEEDQLLTIVKILFEKKYPSEVINLLPSLDWLFKQRPQFKGYQWAVYKKLVCIPLFQWLSPKSPHSVDFITFYSRQLALLLRKENIPLPVKTNPRYLLVQKIIEEINSKNSIPEHADEVAVGKKDIGQKKVLEEEGIFVENGGLVLLHPFLAGYFQQVGLTKENKFLNDFAAMKAVVLSQYLCGTYTGYEDQQLQLSKIICGFPIDEPVLSGIEISTMEQEEADSLLSQVITMWKKNNVQVNGTIEGFQQSFLQRQAKLQPKNKGWHLQVEQKPYDMVMSTLPWGFSLVKTPWMKDMLRVDWA